jgi:hypothetical protein
VSTVPAPLVVRLRDLGPALSHEARARLAVDRILAAVDREQATIDLYAAHEPIPEFVATAEVTMQEWTDRLLLLGVLVDTHPRRVRPARRLLRLVRGTR